MNYLSLEEKARLLSGAGQWHTYDCNQKLPSIMMTDGPHGLRKQTSDQLGQNNASEPATCFPTASAIASSWNVQTAERLAKTIAEEAISQKIGIVLGPGVNMKRSPLCGRNFEYFSEDPLLAGTLGTAYVKAMQSKGVGSSLKHFAGNNQETRRQTQNSNIDERALREIYLSAFEMIVKEASPMTVMASYNRLNGIYSCQNRSLLTDILRKEWGFKGAVISDWGACTNLTRCINAGMDLEMPDSSGCHMPAFIKDIKDQKVDQNRLDQAVKNMTDLITRQHQMLDHANVTPVDYTLHNQIARELACDSAVLLKNNGLLPLKAGSDILVIGDLAIHMRYQGGGSSHIHATTVTDAVTALKAAGLTVTYEQGYQHNTAHISTDLEAAAVVAAKKAAEHHIPILFFGGLPETFEGEGFDRTTLSIPKNQLHLLELLYNVNPQIAFISFSGSAIDFSFEHMTQSILQMYLGGQAVGEACADLITGKVCPSGRLAETFPMKLTDVPSYSYFGQNSDDVQYRESLFIGYRYYDTFGVPVRYPFGFGLSYTTFTYSDLSVDEQCYESGSLGVNVTVTNTGNVTGKEVVQIYVMNPQCNYLRPVRQLGGFLKVELKPQESRRVSVTLKQRSFEIFDTESGAFLIPSGDYEIEAAASVDDIRLSTVVHVTGKDYKRDDREYLKEYFDQMNDSDHNRNGFHISEAQFEKLYGRPLHHYDLIKKGEYTTTNSLSQLSKHSLLGKIVLFASKRIVYGMYKGKPHDDPEVMMFLKGAMEGTIDSIICQSAGMVPYKIADAIVLSANGHHLKAIKKLCSSEKHTA